MVEKRKTDENNILEKDVFYLQKDRAGVDPYVLAEGVFENVLKLSHLLARNFKNKEIKISELKKQLLLLESKGIKFSPFVKRFVLQNFPTCVREVSDKGEKEKNILIWMHHKALTDPTLLHIDFVEYKRVLAKDFSSLDKAFFLNACSVTEQLISADSKATLFKSPDIRINEIENETLVKVPEMVKAAVKHNLFSFKRERIRLSAQKSPLLIENYALLKKMCQKYLADMPTHVKKCPFETKKKTIRTGRTKS